MAKNVNLEALEGIKNLNDPDADDCEKISLDQAKAMVDVADSIIDIYKVQVDALKAVAHMDHMNSPENILVGMGVADAEEIKMIS